MTEVLALTLVLPGPPAPLGAFRLSDVTTLKREVRRAFDDSRVVDWAALAIDISLNDNTQRRLGIFWQVHLHGFLSVGDKAQLSKALRLRFPRSETVAFPQHLSDYDKREYGTSYGFKTDFVRRVSYWDFRRDDPCWNTKSFSLKARQHIELLIALDQIGIAGRLLFYHLGIHSTNGGVATLAVKQKSDNTDNTGRARRAEKRRHEIT